MYIKNSEKFTKTKKVLELLNEFSKVARQKINTQPSIIFLYSSNEQAKK